MIKNTTIHFPLIGMLLFLFICSSDKRVFSQCIPMPVTHFSGTESFGCVEVTVTSAGGTNATPTPQCGIEPYWIGYNGPGSFTFTFSDPIPEARFSFAILNNWLGGEEEMSFEVNGSFYPITIPGAVNPCGSPGVISPAGTIIGTYDPLASAWNDVLITGAITSLTIENIWLTGTPGGVAGSLYICCPLCETDAGEITAAPLELCVGDPATVPPAEQTYLDGNDLLQYILFSDLGDTLGSIFSTSNIPEFDFIPSSMSTGVTYYIAAIAGNDLNGFVDLTDRCIDISNAIEVVWEPIPFVSFIATNTNVCRDSCYDIDLIFTGVPPFQLVGEVIAGTTVLSTFSETYPATVGILNICLPDSTPVGNVTIQATELVDEQCGCN